jgi:hypothetical protein
MLCHCVRVFSKFGAVAMILKSLSTGVCPIVGACRIGKFIVASLGLRIANGDRMRASVGCAAFRDGR